MLIQSQVVEQTISCNECGKDIYTGEYRTVVMDNPFDDGFNGLFCLNCAEKIVEMMREYLTEKSNEICRLRRLDAKG